MQVGDFVNYADATAEELKFLYRVIEINDDRVLMECINTGMSIYPTFVAYVSELKIINN